MVKLTGYQMEMARGQVEGAFILALFNAQYNVLNGKTP